MVWKNQHSRGLGRQNEEAKCNNMRREGQQRHRWRERGRKTANEKRQIIRFQETKAVRILSELSKSHLPKGAWHELTG